MDPLKENVASFLWLALPTTVTETRHIIGFASYYRKFIANFNDSMRPLSELTRKNIPLVWSLLCEVSFDTIKITLTVQFFFQIKTKHMHSLLIHPSVVAQKY